MALSAHIKKREKAYIRDFSADLKALEIKRIIFRFLEFESTPFKGVEEWK